MMGYGKWIMTLAIGAALAFPVFASPAWAGDQDDDAAKEGNAYESTYRNTWNHRNMTRNSYGDMGEGAASRRGLGFVDENGDGINDLAPDHDGDGVPNCQDPDWVKGKKDGTGYKHGNRLNQGGKRDEASQARGNKKAR